MAAATTLQQEWHECEVPTCFAAICRESNVCVRSHSTNRLIRGRYGLRCSVELWRGMCLQGGQVGSIGGAESPGAMPRGPCRSARQQQYLGESLVMEQQGMIDVTGMVFIVLHANSLSFPLQGCTGQWYLKTLVSASCMGTVAIDKACLAIALRVSAA